ncbi:MAG: hypothetical protein AMXMBFR64_54530 [Myxococcales bacterium]
MMSRHLTLAPAPGAAQPSGAAAESGRPVASFGLAFVWRVLLAIALFAFVAGCDGEGGGYGIEGDAADEQPEETATPYDNLYAKLTSVSSFFSQNNTSWACNGLGTCSNTTIGTCGTKTPAGCAITAAAMALKARGASVNPGTLNTYLKNNGGYASGCSVYWAKVADFDGSGGLKWKGTGSLTTVSALKSLLDAGSLVVAKSNRFTNHWVVVSGYGSTGTSWSHFTYLDPWDTTATTRKLGDGWVGSGAVTRIYY